MDNIYIYIFHLYNICIYNTYVLDLHTQGLTTKLAPQIHFLIVIIIPFPSKILPGYRLAVTSREPPVTSRTGNALLFNQVINVTAGLVISATQSCICDSDILII